MFLFYFNLLKSGMYLGVVGIRVASPLFCNLKIKSAAFQHA